MKIFILSHPDDPRIMLVTDAEKLEPLRAGILSEGGVIQEWDTDLSDMAVITIVPNEAEPEPYSLPADFESPYVA